MKNLMIIVKEDFLNLIKNPMWVFYATGFPILMIAIVGYMTRNSYGGMITSYDYYGITLMIYTALNSGMTSANAFMEERIKKPNMRIIYAPGSVKNIFISKIIASFIFALMFHTLDMVFVSLCFGIFIENAADLFVLLAMTELFSVTLGVMMCCVMKSENAANQIQSILVNIMTILGGCLFSIDGYGEAARKLSMVSPVKWVVKLSFQMIYDNDLHLFIPVIMVLALCIGVMLVVCSVTFRRENCIC